MSNQKHISSIELGNYLMRVRERSGVKQAELAKKINWSPASLSRVESGDKELSQEELAVLTNGIGTEDAYKVQNVLQRNWLIVNRPQLDHPDSELLWLAEEAAQKLDLVRQKADIRLAFERRVTEYINEIIKGSQLLLNREHQVAFIGSIGIGKSTAICRIAELEVVSKGAANPLPVLESGAGGITICEVHLRSGPGYGLIIEPRSEEEIRADVMDFAEFVGGFSNLDGQVENEETQGISKEVERAIRNMSKLNTKREKGTDGKINRSDEAKDLAKNCSSTREFVVEILSRMELHKRDKRDLWYETSSGKLPLDWLKDTFASINNGRNLDVSLPKRIEVVVPHELLKTDNLSVRFIDTKGIDRTAARADIEKLLDESHTIALLCSRFNDAPAAEARLLLERAKESGVTGVSEKVALLVLPHPNEALAVKYESGDLVEDVSEGYELKHEQISMSLQPLGFEDLPVSFFNSHQDDPELLKSFLSDRISVVRKNFRNRLFEVINSANGLLLNQEREQAQAVIRQAAAQLRAWTQQRSTPIRLIGHVQDSLVEQMQKAYAATVRATVNREGDWANLNYGHHLGFGARRLAVFSLEKLVDRFTDHCKTMQAVPDFDEATGLIIQAERVMRSSYDDLLRKVQIMGQTRFKDELKLDKAFWTKCSDEWGQGPGYKNRVTEHNKDWFSDEERLDLENELLALIQREWDFILMKVNSLLEMGDQ
jgi:transcriptional regulator with XRE-family HTH domain